MGIVRNGIKKRNAGKEPEAILSALFGGAKVASIGDVGLIDDVISALISIIKKLTAGKKDKSEVLEPTANDMPSSDDFADMTPEDKKEIQAGVRNQVANKQGDDDDSDGDTDSKGNTKASESDGGQPKKGMC